MCLRCMPCSAKARHVMSDDVFKRTDTWADTLCNRNLGEIDHYATNQTSATTFLSLNKLAG